MKSSRSAFSDMSIDLLDSDGVDALLQSGQSTETWTLLNLALWWKEHFA